MQYFTIHMTLINENQNKKIMNKKFILAVLRIGMVLLFFTVCNLTNAQIKYANGRLTFGQTEPYEFYTQTIYGTGVYFKCKANNFFQINLTPAATRLASHSDQVVFYNTKTSTFNSIQVKNVYNYSDIRSKSNITNLTNSLNTILKLRPVSYNFLDHSLGSNTTFSIGGNGKEIGLIAQEVEQVLPNAVLTDDKGQKLINYTALIPVLINAVQMLQAEILELKNNKK